MRRYHPFLLYPLLCHLCFGCAYYNTFYNAKQDYREAMKVKEQSPTQRAPTAKLDKCIERCGKLINFYPNSQWVDDAIVLMGKCYYEKEEYDKALRKFEETIIYYSQSPLLQEAHFLKGEAYLKQGDYVAAVAAFQNAGALGGELEEESALKIAECYLASEDYQDAARTVRRFLTGYPESKLMSNALKTLGDALFEMGALEEAIVQYEKLLRMNPKRKTFFEVSLKIGAACLSLDEVEKALETLSGVENKAEDERERAQLFIWIADCQRALGRFEEALTTLKGVTERLPGSDEAQEAFYKMGVIYEEDLADLDEARKSYDRVRETGFSSEYAKNALLKSSSIGRLTEYRETLSGGEESELARTQFLLAELHLLDLGKPEQAIEEYEKVVTDFPTSDYGPKAAFAVAWVYENVQEDSVLAITAYYRVITKYPGTSYAAASEEAIGRLIPEADTPRIEPQGEIPAPESTNSSNE